MGDEEEGNAGIWEEMAQHLDTAMAELRGPDRDALLMRHFENGSLREVGEALGITEAAARKRVARALDRLRNAFRRRGLSISAVMAGTALAQNRVRAAPPLVRVSVGGSAVGNGAAAAASVLEIAEGIMKMTSWAAMRAPLAVATCLAVVAILVVPRGESAPIPGTLDSAFSPPQDLVIRFGDGMSSSSMLTRSDRPPRFRANRRLPWSTRMRRIASGAAARKEARS